jgi:hypothetical protein
VVAVWEADADEPWILATSLTGSAQELATYARRWSIESLFRAWKSRGWQLEHLHAPTPARVARLLTGMVLATLWTLAIGIAHTTSALAAAPQRRRRRRRQPRLPGCAPKPRDPRPPLAKRSLFSWGRHVLAATATACTSPQRCWTFPDWLTPTWQAFCLAHWSP